MAVAAQMANRSNPPEGRAGLLETNTLFTVYGRGFGVAPILGKLGTYSDIEAMEADTRDWVDGISAVNGGKGVIRGIHLIYALAVPCVGKGDCLDYLGKGIIAKYIEPAAARGWAVVLDTQLGRSTPVDQVNRMIAAGYLKYDNVHVAIDPEFHLVEGHLTPGIPIGTVDADQINEVQRILDDYVVSQNLRTRKILIVHQFGDPAVHDGVPDMIRDKTTLKDFDNVELAIDADGLGPPAEKAHKYNLMTSSAIYPFIQFRGIKVFYQDPGETHGHFDKPPMTIDQVFGLEPVARGLKMAAKPDVVIIA